MLRCRAEWRPSLASVADDNDLQGTSYSWGIMQAALVEEGLAPATSLSFVGSLAVFFIAFLALINARIIRALGARNTGEFND